MIIVLGNSPKKVDLKDIGDCVYYKQQKVFSSSQYERSSDLKSAVEKGSLIKLKEVEERTGTYDMSSVSISQHPTSLETKSDSKLKEDKSEKLLEYLIKKIEDIEGRFSSDKEYSKGSDKSLESLQESIKKIEEKLSNNKSVDSNIDEAISRIESLILKGSKPGSTEVYRPLEEGTSIKEDVYVPNISVEDGKSHIKLDVRTIDSGDDVLDSLKRLKELKSRNK